MFKKLLLITLVTSLSVSSADQRQDITQVKKELQYLKEVVQKLEKLNRNENAQSRVSFNYPALIDQLNVTINGIEEYLNADLKVIQAKPTPPVKKNLTQVKPNE